MGTGVIWELLKSLNLNDPLHSFSVLISLHFKKLLSQQVCELFCILILSY